MIYNLDKDHPVMDVTRLELEARKLRAEFVATQLKRLWLRLVAVTARKPISGAALNN